MKKVLFAGIVILWSVAAVVNAAETTTSAAPKPVAAAPASTSSAPFVTTIDVTYASKYIWRGFDILDDVSAWQPSANFDFGNGFSANIWASYAGSSGLTEDGISRVNRTQYNYTLAYSGTYAESCPWKTDYMVGWRYYDFIDNTSKELDMQEVFVEFAMPALLGDSGVTPRGAVYQMWDAKGEGLNEGSSGTIYVMGMGYGFTLDQAPELPMTFGWDIVYNDGTGADTVDHDWSHMVWSLQTSFTCPMTGGKITPGVYFQNSFEDTVNNEDELWGMISYALSF